MEAHPQQLWEWATAEEQRVLGSVYSRLRTLPVLDNEGRRDVMKIAAWCGGALEIFMDYNYNKWSKDYLLTSKVWELQVLLSRFTEQMFIDHFQRTNYMKLILGGQEAHKNVAYGLSETFIWSEKEFVVSQLQAMGNREYEGEIPSGHENDNNVLHVAVSYKHSAKHDEGGTISNEQAEAIWLAVRNLLDLFSCPESAEVRVWIDQNIHRMKLPRGTEWHEYGLLPYACLRTVFVGTGDFSLRHAFTRPWLWVEMVAGLKSDGIHTKPGYDLFQECDDVISPLERYQTGHNMRVGLIRQGWLLGPGRNVDETMSELTRLISLWRRRDFMNHSGYEYADEFERFVNWARWFVIRGKPYSEMSWNHSSVEVHGMDAVTLVRAFPREGGWQAESLLALVEANVTWKTDQTGDHWVIGDLFDRTLVPELRLKDVLECEIEEGADCTDLLPFGKFARLMSARFRKRADRISLASNRPDRQFSRVVTKYAEALDKIDEDSSSGTIVHLTTADSDGKLLIYRPFTQRIEFGKRQGVMPTGDAMLLPARLDESTKLEYEMENVGVCFNAGVCEMVYSVQVGVESVRVSSTEATAVLNATGGNTERFKELLSIVKRNALYKLIRYKDLSEAERLRMTRRWRVPGMQNLNDKSFVSGEIDVDTEEELCEAIPKQNRGRTLIWVDDIRESGGVRISFSCAQGGFYFITNGIAATRELALIEESDTNLMNRNSQGVLQVLSRAQIGERYNVDVMVDGNEKYFLAKGDLVICDCCHAVVCPVNGLCAEIGRDGDVDTLCWTSVHRCTGHEYVRYWNQAG